MDDLVGVLQRERDRLEQLRFRFVSLELLVSNREVRFWDWALQDLNRARLRVRETDLVRAAAVSTLRVRGARGAPSLREVAAAVPSPWAGMLRDHHDGLTSVVADIELHAHRIAQDGREAMAELARSGTLGAPVAPPTPVLVGVGDDGASVVEAAPPVSPTRLRAPGQADDLDPVSIECLLGDVIAGAGRLRIPALLAFLR